jgi:hypothetical protein
MSYILESNAKTRYRELLAKADQHRRMLAATASRPTPLQTTRYRLGTMLVRLGKNLQQAQITQKKVTDVR